MEISRGRQRLYRHEEKSGGLGAAKDLEGKGYLNVNATLEKMESYKPGLGKIEGYFRGMRNEKS